MRILSHLLKKSLMKILFFCAMCYAIQRAKQIFFFLTNNLYKNVDFGAELNLHWNINCGYSVWIRKTITSLWCLYCIDFTMIQLWFGIWYVRCVLCRYNPVWSIMQTFFGSTVTLRITMIKLFDMNVFIISCLNVISKVRLHNKKDLEIDV